MVVCAHMLTHILRRWHSEIHQTGMIHDLWSHRGATNTSDTLHTCVMPDAGNQEYHVMDTIFTVKHTVHTVNSYSPSKGTLYLYHCTYVILGFYTISCINQYWISSGVYCPHCFLICTKKIFHLCG